jgi:glycosyltransferase involved in cell wall biosynthesis
MLGLGFQPVNPVIIKNAVDASIFNRNGRAPFDRNRKIRLISTAWSPNPRKGGPFYKSLEEVLDWNRFEYTFVGTTKETFSKIRHVPAVPSEQLADILRQHDLYIMASQGEAYSNALIEALSCGLPALYLADGGNGEAVGLGGLPFKEREDAMVSLGRLVDQYELFQSAINVESIESIARRYLALAERVMNL